MDTEDSAAAVPGRDTGYEDDPVQVDPEAPAHVEIDPDSDPDMLNPRPPVEPDGERVENLDSDPRGASPQE